MGLIETQGVGAIDVKRLAIRAFGHQRGTGERQLSGGSLSCFVGAFRELCQSAQSRRQIARWRFRKADAYLHTCLGLVCRASCRSHCVIHLPALWHLLAFMN